MRLRYFLLALAFIGLTTWLGFLGPHSTAAPASTTDNRLPRQEAASTLTKPEHHALISTAAPVQTGKNAAPFSMSTNGGSTWNSSASGLAGANVRDLAINHTTPATIYAATENGVFKSVDGGGNWSATGLVTFIEVLAIDPVTTTTLYAGGSGGIYKTTDAGSNWSAINSGLGNNSFIPFVTALVIDPTNAATVYAGTSGGGGVFKSTDGGSNWSALNNGLTVTAGTSTFVPTVNTLVLDPINPATLYAGTLKGGGVFKSTNGGATWSAFNKGLTVTSGGSAFVLSVNDLAIDATNPSTLYAGTSSGIFKSTNSGRNWKAFSNGLTNTFLHALIIDPTNAAVLYAGTSKGIFKSLNAADNWSALNNDSTILNINALALDSTAPDNVYAGTSSSSEAFAAEVTDVSALAGAVRPGFSANSLARNDDGSTAAIPLGFPVNFFGNSYSNVFVNNNGNVTFDSILSSYTPFSLTSTQRVIIAAFFADVDTRGSGSTVVTYGTGVVNGRQAFGVNYIDVGYYNSKTDKLNSFQLLLINRSDIAPGSFDIELNYDKIQWETGDSSGGIGGLGGSSARAGFSNGTGNVGTFFELNGSAVPGAFLDSNTSTGLVNRSINSTQLGRYVLEVRGGSVTTGDLAVTLADSPDPVSVGNTLTYTATVRNNSTSQATGVTLTDTLPAGITFVSATASQGTCALSAGKVICSIGNMPAVGNPGATVTATIVVKPTQGATLTNTVSVSGNQPDVNSNDNSATATTVVTPLSISGRVTDGSNNGIGGVLVVLSGTLTRVVQTDATGNYSFINLVGGGNYSVIASSPLYVFTPPRFDFTNLSGNQIANFALVPNAVPSPTPALADDFGGAQRDPAKWNLGTATQPAGAFDGQVTVAQTSGQLVITPRSNVVGPHYNGYASVNAFNLTGGTASVEVAKTAIGGADTIYAIGKDSNNFYRFMVHTAGLPSGLAPEVESQNNLVAQADPTLLLQVVIAGQQTTLGVAYDPVQHHFMRFRHESPQVSPPSGAIVFEASPDDINYTPLRKTPLDRELDPMTMELSAGTAGSTNTDAAKFDNVKLVLSTFQFTSGNYSVGEGEGSVQITVTRAGDKSTPGSVNFTTADGTALQGSKYINKSGTLTFAANESSKTFTVAILDNTLAEGNQTLNVLLSNPTTAGLNSPGRAVLTIVDNETVLAGNQVTLKTWTFSGRTYAYLNVSFPNSGYRVANWGQAVRSGNDFSADAVVEKLTGASVQSVTTTAGIYDLGVVAPGSYNFTFKNSGTMVKSQAFVVSPVTPPPNPIDTAREFVKQQYRDFLNREADQAGEDFWTNNITKCSDPARRPGQTEAQCTVRQRETTSGAFFQSPEFQYTGYYVLRMYKGALGRQPKLSEFTPDAQFVGAGILVNGQLSGAKINQNKADFALQFVNCTDATKSRCAEFKVIYDGLNNQQYVDKLFLTTGVNASTSDRAALVNGLNANPATETRASVLQKVVDGINVISEGNQQFTTTYGQAFYNAEFNRAFVQLQYFGYLKRDPDDAGYAFWLGKLDQFGGNFVNSELVLAFIDSPEYRARFGQP